MSKLLPSIFFLIIAINSVTSLGQDFQPGTLIICVQDEQSVPLINAETKEIEISNAQLKNLYSSFKVKSFEKAFPRAEKDPVAKKNGIDKIYRLTCDCNEDELMVQLQQANRAGLYRYIEKNPAVHLLYTPDDYHLLDSVYGNDYALDLMHLQEAWDITQGDTSIRIGISDDGFDTLHADLSSNFEFFKAGNNPINNPYHGTFVAGCVGATTDNGTGKSGVAFNCKVVTTNFSAPFVLDILYQLYDLVIDHNVRIINCSWGTCSQSSAHQAVISLLHDLGVVVVASAGNGSAFGCGTLGNGYMYPASYDSVISVTSVGYQDNHYDSIIGSHTHNDKVDICAPGYHVLSTYSGGGYGISSGTSFAAPYVAGVCGLILSVNPFLSPYDVLDIIKATADIIHTLPVNNPPSLIGLLGAGRINAFKAVQAALTYPVLMQVAIQGDSVIPVCTPVHAYSINFIPTQLFSVDWQVTNGVILSGQGTHEIKAAWDSAAVQLNNSQVRAVVNWNDSLLTEKIFPVTFEQTADLKISGDSIIYNCGSFTRNYRVQLPPAHNYNIHWDVEGGTFIAGVASPVVSLKWHTPPVSSRILTADIHCASDLTEQKLTFIPHYKDSLDYKITGNFVLCCGSSLTGNQYIISDYHPESFYIRWEVENGKIISGQYDTIVTVDWSLPKKEFTEGELRWVLTSVSGVPCNSFSKKIVTCENGLQLNAFSLHPNPATNILTLNYYIDICQTGRFKLYDALGRKIIDSELPPETFNAFFNISYFQRGLYFYIVEINNKKFFSDKLVVQH